MIKTFKRLAFIFLFSIISCSKDDSVVEQSNAVIHEASINETRTVSSLEIPNIIQYLSSRTNGTMRFEIEGVNQQTRTAEPDLILGETQMDEILQAENSYSRSNYTFKLTTLNTTTAGFVSYYNLIVKESLKGMYSYIIEYRLNKNWARAQVDGLDWSSYTGSLLYYTDAGKYVGFVSVDNGIGVEYSLSNPCEGDETNSGGGSGDDSDTGSNDTNTDGGEGNGGEDISIYVECLPCSHSNHLPHINPCAHPTCNIIVDIGNNVHGNSDIFESVLRNPDCLPPDDCNEQNDCEFGFDANCGCLPEEEEEVENDEVGVNVDLECMIENNNMNASSPYNVDFSSINPCNDQITTPEDDKLLCIYKKLTESSEFQNLFVNTFGESNTLNVEFQVVDSMPIGFENSLGLAVSNYSIDAETNQITNLVIQIMIKRSHLQNDSAISVARTVLHESLHAYLKVKHYGCNQGATFEELDDFDFSELLREYFLSSCSGQSEHEFMFDYMIPTMSNILSDVRDEFIPINHQNIAESHLFWNEDMDSNTNLEIPWLWSEFYKSLSLGGLQNTDAFMFDYLPETSNKYKNFYKYAVEIGQNSFSQNCNE